MIHKSLRKELGDHNWLWIQKNDSNPSMKLKRLEKQSITAINDLSLLAQKLPEHAVAEIFSYDGLKRLVESILRKGNDQECSDIEVESTLDSRRLYLAALFAKEGIKLCIEEHIAQNSESPKLAEATVDQLNKTVELCSEIAYVADLPTRRKSEDNLRYQFNWNRIPGPDEDKFVKLIENIFGSIYENFKDDGINTYRIRKNESVFRTTLQELHEQYSATDKEFDAIAARQRASEIKLEILDLGGGIIAYFSLMLRYSTRTVNLEYKRYRSKAIQLDTTNVVVKQDYGNYYIYEKQK